MVSTTSVRRSVTVAAVATLAGAALSGPASADPVEAPVNDSGAVTAAATCGDWPWPTSATGSWTETRVSLGVGTKAAELRFGYIGGKQAGWARLAGGYEAGDMFWFDVSHDKGKGWYQCGPFTFVDGGHNYTRAHYSSADPNLVFRACGRAKNSSSTHCTAWR
ncbi:MULTISPECIES: hypothetical protein [Streptosporangium]|uniref:Secreted protein n=1 Tax=Streptosporangium brasiliense TaxID=47480 RepID=A0ABT9RJZ6_9ACTN|nr:hypothetical protein [Streptosporangium brasiliense]MDP9869623.1 hypothetical protein [Streptosporangium brasiliense]